MRRFPRFVKLRLLALLAPAAFSGSAALAQLPPGQVFADVPVTAPWYNATNTLHQLGISVGCDLTPDFCPTAGLLRSDMAAFIVRAWSARVWNDPGAFTTQTTQNNTAYFSDVPYGSYQFVYIQKLYELGITSGATPPQIDGNGNLTAQGTFVPANTLHNYEIAVFVARARALSDNGCTAAYYNGTPKPFPVSSNASCAPNNFTNLNEAPYFSDVPSGDSFFKYVQRLGDLNVYQSPSTVIATPGCGTCVFGESNVILRSLMAIWTVSGMGLLPESVLSINAPGVPGGPNGYAVQPAITVAFTFTLYNQAPASIEYGQFLLSNTSGDTVQNPLYCYGNWGATPALSLYDATPETATGYNQPLYDGFCTVSLVSVASIVNPNGVQVTVNFTFNPSAAGVTYNVFHEVIYNEGLEPWENVGTLQVLAPTPMVTLTDLTESTGYYFAGDSYQVTVNAPPNQPVTLTTNGVAQGTQGYTNSSGVFSFSGTWSSADVGNVAESWYVAGVLVPPGLAFQIASAPSCVGGSAAATDPITQGQAEGIGVTVSAPLISGLVANVYFNINGASVNPYSSSVVASPAQGNVWIAQLNTGNLLGEYSATPVVQMINPQTGAVASTRTCTASRAVFDVTLPTPAPAGPVKCASMTGTWVDKTGPNGGGSTTFTWNAIVDNGGTISTGTLVGQDCSTNVTWMNVSGSYTASNQTYSLNASNPSPASVTCPGGVITPVNTLSTNGTLRGGGSCGLGSGTASNSTGQSPDTLTATERIPSGETSSFTSWGDQYGLPTTSIFNVLLAAASGGPSYDFGGRTVTETVPASPPGSDGCFWAGAPWRSPFTQLQTQDNWNVQDDHRNGSYGPDYVGLSATSVVIMQQRAPALGSSTSSCTIQYPQQMVINSETGSANEVYATNMLVFTMTQTTVSVSRGGVSDPQGPRSFHF